MLDTFFNKKSGICLAVAMAITASLLLARCQGTFPTAFSDEYTYSRLTRLLPFSEATIPAYLYFLTYKITNYSESGFLGFVQLLNVFFFVATAPFIYLSGILFTNKRTALLIALLSILGSINSYTSFFMPESMYFFFFWAFTCFALHIRPGHRFAYWCLLGSLLGMGSLVKPHALFLLPGLSLYFLILYALNSTGRYLIPFAGRYIAFIASVFSTKFILGFLIAGKNGISIFGGYYSSHVSMESAHDENTNPLILLTKLGAENFLGQILALLLLFSVAIAQLPSVFRIFRHRNSASHVSMLPTLYAFLTFSFLIVIVACFSASIAHSSIYQSHWRLHMRYYNFAFPLLLLSAASQLTLPTSEYSTRYRVLLGLPIGALILYAIVTRMKIYEPSLIDCPELHGFTCVPQTFRYLSFFSLVSLGAWIYSARAGAKIFLYLFIPLSVLIPSYYIHNNLKLSLRVTTVYDRAGIYTKHFLPDEDISKLVVVGSDYSGLLRTLFHLDNLQASHLLQAPHTTLQPLSNNSTNNLPEQLADKEWALIFDDVSFPIESSFQMPLGGFNLVLLPNSLQYSFVFSRSSWPGRITKSSGLSTAEPWGTWSLGDTVALHFIKPLPQKFRVHLTANAFGPNVGKEFVFQVGDEKTTFTLEENYQERVLEINNPQNSDSIKIIVPEPTSPNKLRLGQDARELGIGLVKIDITPLEN